MVYVGGSADAFSTQRLRSSRSRGTVIFRWRKRRSFVGNGWELRYRERSLARRHAYAHQTLLFGCRGALIYVVSKCINVLMMNCLSCVCECDVYMRLHTTAVSHYLVACACTQSKLEYESNYMHTCYMHTYKPSLHAIQKYKPSLHDIQK